MLNKIRNPYLIYTVTKTCMLLIKVKSMLDISLFLPSPLSINIIKCLLCARHPEDAKISKMSVFMVNLGERYVNKCDL